MTQTLPLTNAGRAAIVNAQHDGTNAVTVTQVGLTASNFALDPALTALPDEFKRLASVSGGATAADTIHVTATDASADIYVLKGVGLYLTDGTLFAVYAQADPIISKAAAALGLISFDVQFVNMGGVSVEFGDANFFNPQATVDVQGVVELATSAETTAKTDTARAVTPKGLWDAFSAWLAAAMVNVWTSVNDGAGSGMDSDLLDGQQGAYYADVPARLGFKPVQQGTGVNQAGSNIVKIGWSTDGRLKATVDVTDQGNFVMEPIMMQQLSLYDGSGSGLDADLLDGQDSGYYTNVVARLGYTPLNQTSYTAADVRAKLLTVDGAGSGLDADLLDGRDSSSFQDKIQNIRSLELGELAGGEGDTYLDIHATSGSDFDARLLRASGANGALTLVQTGSGNINLDGGSALCRGGNLVWHAGNDGAGSGLDADLFDGQDSSYYANVVARLGYTPVNKAGDVVAGNLGVTGTLYPGNAAQFYLSATGGNPYENWDAGDYVWYDRTNNIRATVIGNVTQSSVSSDGNVYARAGFKVGANLVWHAGNDGSGSGLDADLLDGRDSSSFQDKIQNVRSLELGELAGGEGDTYIDIHATTGSDFDARLHRASGANGALTLVQTGSGNINLDGGSALYRGGNLVWHAGNDGASSGLDADLLDGQDSSYYANVVARLGYTPLNQTSYTATDVRAKLVTVDGAGSGIDADLLDGLDGSAYVQKSAIMPDFAAMMALVWNGAFGPNAFRLGGLLVQMGSANTVNGNDVATVTFPTAFAAAPFVIPIRRTSGAITNADSGVGIEGTPTTTIVKLRNTTAGTTVDIMWIAIGPA